MATDNLSIMVEEDHDKKTKQSRRRWVSEFQSHFTADEMEIAQLLLNIPYLFTQSLSEGRFFPCWSSKRRRSALCNPPLSPSPPEVHLAPPPQNPVVSPASKPEANSPDTPLAFCPSDSDVKSRQSTKRKTSLKRTRDEWLRTMDEQIQIKDTLQKEIDDMNLRKRKLKDENSNLKDKQLRLIQSTEREKTQLEVCEGLSNPVTECPQQQPQLQPTVVNNDNVLPGPSTPTMTLFHRPSIPLHPIIGNHLTAQGAQIHFNNQDQRGPPNIDLNIPAIADDMVTPEQLQPLDHHHHRIVMEMMMRNYTKQARAAAARQYRIQQIKSKKAQRGTS